MTAPDPTAEHIDAVADAIYLGVAEGASYPQVARRLLTTDYPLVHVALAASLPAEVMLAALVDRGTLKRITSGGVLGDFFGDGTPVLHSGIGVEGKFVTAERFQTHWREVAP